ncbi:MAG TPA: hypothetical protein VMD79_11415 [Solirubrobacteraceae bacterium]|nr:hypothetical protein [Solirubrobacteraceae bacterium]
MRGRPVVQRQLGAVALALEGCEERVDHVLVELAAGAAFQLGAGGRVAD